MVDVTEVMVEAARRAWWNSAGPTVIDDWRAAVTAAAPLIAAVEREACARLVENYADTIARLSGGAVPSFVEVACTTIAAAMRARVSDNTSLTAV